MDTVTHSLLGALVARASAPAAGTASPHLSLGARSVAGALAAAFPDIDYLSFWIDPLTFLADWHRGPTHSIVLLPVWALSLGLVFAVLGGLRAHWRELVAVCALALASHIASDVITAYGTQIFSPVSDLRISLGTTFVIDAYFSAIIVLGLLASRRWNPRRTARYAGLTLVLYVGAQGLVQRHATAIAADHARTAGLTGATASALPQPFSPFNWKLILAHGDSFRVASVSLLPRESFAALGGVSCDWPGSPRHSSPRTACPGPSVPVSGTPVRYRPRPERSGVTMNSASSAALRVFPCSIGSMATARTAVSGSPACAMSCRP